MAGLEVALAILKMVAYGAIIGALLIAALIGTTWVVGKVSHWSTVSTMNAINSLLPRDWASVKRKEGIVFCSEVWYDLPVKAQWITLDRRGLIQCWQAKPTYYRDDGEWHSHQLNPPFNVGHMSDEWTAPYAWQTEPPIQALPEDTCEVDAA